MPQPAIVAAVRGEVLLENNDKTAAGRAFAEARSLSPKAATWLLILAARLEQAGAYDVAIASYRDVLVMQPTNVVALNNLAYALAVHAKSPAEALPIAKRAATLAPRSGTILDTLAWTEHLLGNDETAARVPTDAMRLNPRDPEIRLHAAIVFAAMGMPERAEAELKEASQLNPQIEARDEVKALRARLPKDDR